MVLLKGWVEIISPVPRTEAIIGIKTAGVWVVWGLHPIVPLAENSSFIAGLLEYLRNGRFVCIDSLTASGCAVYTASGMISSSKEFRSRVRAHRANKKMLKHGTITGQRINAECGKIRVAIQAQISPTLIA